MNYIQKWFAITGALMLPAAFLGGIGAAVWVLILSVFGYVMLNIFVLLR